MNCLPTQSFLRSLLTGWRLLGAGLRLLRAGLSPLRAGQGLQRHDDVTGRLVLGMELGAVHQQLSPARREDVTQPAHEHRSIWGERPEERRGYT